MPAKKKSAATSSKKIVLFWNWLKENSNPLSALAAVFGALASVIIGYYSLKITQSQLDQSISESKSQSKDDSIRNVKQNEQFTINMSILKGQIEEMKREREYNQKMDEGVVNVELSIYLHDPISRERATLQSKFKPNFPYEYWISSSISNSGKHSIVIIDHYVKILSENNHVLKNIHLPSKQKIGGSTYMQNSSGNGFDIKFPIQDSTWSGFVNKLLGHKYLYWKFNYQNVYTKNVQSFEEMYVLKQENYVEDGKVLFNIEPSIRNDLLHKRNLK